MIGVERQGTVCEGLQQLLFIVFTFVYFWGLAWPGVTPEKMCQLKHWGHVCAKMFIQQFFLCILVKLDDGHVCVSYILHNGFF